MRGDLKKVVIRLKYIARKDLKKNPKRRNPKFVESVFAINIHQIINKPPQQQQPQAHQQHPIYRAIASLFIMLVEEGEPPQTSENNDTTPNKTAEKQVEVDMQKDEPASPPPPPPPNEEVEKKQIQLGGSNPTNGNPAYALLTGIWTNNDDESDSKGEEVVVNIPITNIPIVLGRSWGSTAKDPHHVALPRDEKLLSRLHACIFYRDEKGGRLGCYEIVSEVNTGSSIATDKITYEPFNSNASDENGIDPDNIYRLPGMKQTDPLPQNGFYAIECLGRHTISVGDKKVTKGKQAMLEDGMPIRIASYCFYFLLPKDAAPINQTFKYSIKKAQGSDSLKKETSPKPKASEEAKLSKSEEVKEPPVKKSRKSEDYTSKLDNVSTTDLLSQLTTATESKDWSKEDQLVTATLGVRIVREAAKNSNIQKIAREQHGVTQRDIIDWYKAHALFSDFERLMMSKIEYKSYQSGITKAIQRAGYTRNESNPGKSRCTRWDLPADIPLVHAPSSPRSNSKSPRKSTEDTVKHTGDEVQKPTLNEELSAESVKTTGLKLPDQLNNESNEKATGLTLPDQLNNERNEKATGLTLPDQLNNESNEKATGIILPPADNAEDVPLSEVEKSLPPPKP